jgi:hypothetical protein
MDKNFSKIRKDFSPYGAEFRLVIAGNAWTRFLAFNMMRGLQNNDT